MLTLVTMGRRAKTNCSPVDSALEKYHNDIGNRLSGLFLPPPPAHPCCPTTTTTNSSNDAIEDSTCDAFSMLTLDFRGKHGVKNTTTPAACHKSKSSTMPTLINNRKDNNNNNDESSSETDSLHQKDDSAFDQNTPSPHSTHNPSRSNTLPAYTTSQQSSDYSNDTVSSSKRPTNIMDKLARAIFQRKHTCARCQRRSRSCLQNKTFTVHEKHYTCARCRETSRAFKNLVTGPESKSHNNSSSDDKEDDAADDIILRKPRLQLKDSGYETVTSCSTVASAHSNSNSPYASANRQQHNHTTDSSNPCGATTSTTTTATTPEYLRVSPSPATPSEVDHEVDELIRKANNGTTVAPYFSGHRDNNSTIVPSGNPHQHHHHHHNHHHHPDSSHPTHDYVNVNLINSGIEQYLGGVGDQGCRVLKQVKTRFVQDYDGYLNLPTSDHHAHNNTSDDDGYCNCGDHSHPNSDIITDFTHNVKSTNSTNKPSPKMCHVCETTSRPCFRLPWEGGWLCEECIDGML